MALRELLIKTQLITFDSLEAIQLLINVQLKAVMPLIPTELFTNVQF